MICNADSIALLESEKTRDFVIDIGLPLDVANNILGLSASDFIKWLNKNDKNDKAILPISKIKDLSDFIGIDKDLLISGNYDKKKVRSILFKNETPIPDKYIDEAYNSVAVWSHISEYISITKGQHFADSVLKKINVSPIYNNTSGNRINLLFLSDLLKTLRNSGFSESDMDCVGGSLPLYLYKSHMYNSLKNIKASNYSDHFKSFLLQVSLVDNNFENNIIIDEDTATIKSFFQFDKHSKLASTKLNLNTVTHYRKMVFSWSPYLSGLPPVDVSTDQKQTLTGIETTYLIKFPSVDNSWCDDAHEAV